MKTIISTNELRKFLIATNQIKNTVLPICEDVFLSFSNENCKAIVTDLEISFVANIPCKGETFEICVPKQVLSDFLKSYKGNTLEVVKQGLKTSFSGFVITGNDVDEFPLLPEMNETRSLTFSPALNYELIEAAKFVGSDDLRPVMSGVCLSNKYGFYGVVSTNSHYLYQANLGSCDKDVEQFELILGGSRFLASFIKSLKLHNEPVLVEFNDINARLVYTDFEIITRLIDGKYPNYEAVIPQENPLLLQVGKATLFGAIDMVKNACSRSSKQVVFEKTETGLLVTGMDLDYDSFMQVEIPCEFNAEIGFKIAFNYNFLLELFKSNIGDELNMELSTPNKACVNRSYHRLMLLMPVMIVEPEYTVEPSEEETEIESDEVEA